MLEVASLLPVVPPVTSGVLPFEADEVERSIPERFRRVAALVPDQLAIQDSRQGYTYRALDELSDRVAGALAPLLPEPEARVLLLFAPGQAGALVALVGLLKAGACYAALDPSFPPERNRALWDDAAPSVLLTDRQHAALALDIAGGRQPVLVLEEILAPPARPAPRPAAPQPAVSPDHLSALLYTSGSTGRPKGVERSHRQTLQRARINALNGAYGPRDRLLLTHFIAYAAANSHLFGALLNGVTLYTLDLHQLSVPELLAFLERESITIFSLPITFFRQVVEQAGGPLALPHLRQLGMSGEALLKTDVEAFRRLFPPTCVILHSLATSEAGLVARLRIDHDLAVTTPRLPVGRPVPGMEILLWDEGGQPVEAGQIGEIVLRSVYLARGYWRNPELTRQVFLPDPDGGDRRLYRTGDLGRLLPDGSLLHLGRKDQMVKIRGYRVEPAEVELALQQVDPRPQAAVVAFEREPGQHELIAFVVPAAGSDFSAAALRRALAESLPDYMLPARIIRLEQWPLNTSGKIDRQALRARPLLPAEPSESYVAPRDDNERMLAALWEKVLRLAPVGVHDNFFDLGGHSLAAVALVGHVTKATGRRLPMTAFFQAPTVAEMAALLRGERQQPALPEAIAVLQPLGQRLPLFLVPELEVSAMTLVKVIRWMGTERPVYGLQPRGYVDGQQPWRTIPATAAYYLEAIRAVRPHGPYLLAGLCYGGVVAFEMARQLAAQGERVPALCVVDVPTIRLRQPGGAARVGRKLFAARRAWQLWKEDVRIRLLSLHTRWRSPPETPSLETHRPGYNLRFPQRLALAAYSPDPYAGPLNVLQSEEYQLRDSLGDWRRAVPGRLALRVVPGTKHTDVLGSADHVKHTVAWLVECLEQADPPG